MIKKILAFVFLALSLKAAAQTSTPCANGAVTPADDCFNACIACNLEGYQGQTNGFTAGTAPGFCDQVSGEQWIGFVATQQAVSITLQPSNCTNGDGLQAAVYQNCSNAPLLCNAGQAGGGNLPITLTGTFVPGQSYYLMVDGYHGDDCQFEVGVSPMGATTQSPVGVTGAIQGPWVVAPSSVVVYSVPPASNATYYIWDGPVNTLINGLIPPISINGPSGQQVTVTFGSSAPLSGEICVTPGNACSTGNLSCHTVFIGNTYLPPACPSSSAFASDDCSNACVYCDFNGYSGTTGGYTSGFAAGFCGSVENEQWFGLIAATTEATFIATPFNCTNGDGIQVALYSDCTGAPIACNGGAQASGDVPIFLTATLVPGQQYFLLVDGFAGDQCEFTLAVDPPAAVEAPMVGQAGNILGATQVCPEATVNYSVPPVAGAGAYVWSGPPGSLINGYTSPALITGSDGNQVQITFSNAGGTICVTPLNSCFQNSTTVCKTVSVIPIPPTTLPVAIICYEDAPYELPWGETVFVSGNYQTILSSWLGCDSVVRQQVIIKAPIVSNLAPRYLCVGDCVMICGEEYCEPGVYSQYCESYQGCDSLVNFTIITLAPVANIIPPGQGLSCTTPCLTLMTAPSAGIRIWRNSAGQIIGSGNSVEVCTAGTYFLSTTLSGGGVNCFAMDTIQVTGDLSPIIAQAIGGELSCASPAITLDGSADAPGATFSWTGPNNFQSSLEDPIVNAPGDYTLIVAHPTSGCTASAVATVNNSGDLPEVVVVDAVLNCNISVTTIQCTTNIDPAEFAWEGPGGYGSQDQNPLVVAAGTYTVTVTNPATGCTNSATAEVALNVVVPTLSTIGDTLNCFQSSGIFSLHATSSAVVPNYSWLGPAGFSSSDQNPVVSIPGPYNVTVTDLNNGCTASSETAFVVDINVPTADASGGTLTCTVFSLSLYVSTTATTPSFAWAGPDNFTSTSQTPIISVPGTYFVTVTDLQNGCTNSAQTEVFSDMSSPVVNASGGVLSCSHPQVTLQADGFPEPPNFQWSGPGGFSSTLSNPTVSEPGDYTVIITNDVNGCTASDVAQVLGDFTVPSAYAVGGTLTCDVTSVQLEGGSSSAMVEFTWYGPDSMILANPIATEPGLYTLVVTGANGCTSIAWAFVDEDILEPQITVIQVVDDLNGLGLGSIDISVNAPMVTWSVNGTPFSMAEDVTGLVAGTYHVEVQSVNGCISSLDIVVENTVGTHDVAALADWRLFPNPTDGVLFADLASWNGQQIWARVFNSQGQLIQTNSLMAERSPQSIVLPASLPSGLYGLEITLENGEKRVKRFVVQR